jgi:hypothetical protein
MSVETKLGINTKDSASSSELALSLCTRLELKWNDLEGELKG